MVVERKKIRKVKESNAAPFTEVCPKAASGGAVPVYNAAGIEV
jgi:hypothetical protein